jgi:hypothetical protein
VADDLRALERSGKPWAAVAAVAARLRAAAREDLLSTARRHIAPVEQLRWRLFHLAVFGETLRVFRSVGADLVNLRPLSGSDTGGPNLRATTNHGNTWDIWFESSAVWSYYGWQSPYQKLTRSPERPQPAPLGADIVALRPGARAVLVECKYGPRDYVARHGYLQAVTYSAELSRHVEEPVAGIVVGPASAVPRFSQVELPGFTVALANPQDAATALRALLEHD